MQHGSNASALAAVDGRFLVVGSAGAGKTALIVERCGQLVAGGVAPRAIVVLAPTERRRADLRARLAPHGLQSVIDVRSFSGMAALVRGGGRARFHDGRLLSPVERRLIVERAVALTATASLPEAVRTSRAFARELIALAAAIDRAGVVPADDAPSPRLRDCLAILATVRDLQRRCGGRGPGDLIAAAAAAAAVPGSAAAAVMARFAHVLVDGGEDIGRPLVALLARCSPAATMLVAVDPLLADRPTLETCATALGLEERHLGPSRRCSPAAVVLAAAGDPAVPTSRAATDDDVRVVRLRRVDDEAAWIADAVEARLVAGDDPESIAVIARDAEPLLAIVAAMLESRVIATTRRVEGAGGSERLATLRAALRWVAAPREPGRLTELLTAPTIGGDPLRAAAGARVQPDAAPLLPTAEFLVSLGLSAERAGAVRAALAAARAAWEAGDAGRAARTLVRRLGLVRATLDEPPARVAVQSRRLATVCDTLARVARTAALLDGARGTAIAVERLDDILMDAPNADGGVALLTVEQAAGCEFATVFVADAVDERFPRRTGRSMLFDVSDRAWLVAHHVVLPAEDVDNGTERRWWYVACTRAAARLVVSCSETALDGRAQAPSRFLAGRVPSRTSTSDRTPLEIAALRASRDVMPDLVAGDGDPMRVAAARDATAAFTPADERPIRLPGALRVSDVDAWLTCPRRWFFARIAGLRDGAPAMLAAGTVLHAALAAFHRRRPDLRSGRAGGHESWAPELCADADAALAATAGVSGDEGHAIRTKLHARLLAYARKLEEHVAAHPSTTVGVERDVAVMLGDERLGGRIDRLERNDDDTLTVVDYKLGPDSKKAVPPLQLDIYAHAVGARHITYVYFGGAQQMPSRNAPLFVRRAADVDAVERALQAMREHVVEPMRAGTLHSLPVTTEPKICETCPFAALCDGAAA